MSAGPLARIDGPLPLRPRYGLLQAATSEGVQIVPGDERDRWINGVNVIPYPPDAAGTFDAGTLCGTSPDEKDTGEEIPLPTFNAFTVYLPITCTSHQVGNQEAFRARAVAALEAVEGAAVERELKTGSGLGLQNPYLANGEGTFPLVNVTTDPINGLALLELEIADSGRQGLIHCSPALATAWKARHLISDVGGVLRTINGTIVIPGQGYADGGHPLNKDAATGTEEWVYATGPVDIRRSEVFTNPPNLSEALERSTNEITYRAERYFLVDWDTVVQAAVLIDRCVTEC